MAGSNTRAHPTRVADLFLAAEGPEAVATAMAGLGFAGVAGGSPGGSEWRASTPGALDDFATFASRLASATRDGPRGRVAGVSRGEVVFSVPAAGAPDRARSSIDEILRVRASGRELRYESRLGLAGDVARQAVAGGVRAAAPARPSLTLTYRNGARPEDRDLGEVGLKVEGRPADFALGGHGVLVEVVDATGARTTRDATPGDDAAASRLMRERHGVSVPTVAQGLDAAEAAIRGTRGEKPRTYDVGGLERIAQRLDADGLARAVGIARSRDASRDGSPPTRGTPGAFAGVFHEAASVDVVEPGKAIRGLAAIEAALASGRPTTVRFDAALLGGIAARMGEGGVRAAEGAMRSHATRLVGRAFEGGDATLLLTKAEVDHARLDHDRIDVATIGVVGGGGGTREAPSSLAATAVALRAALRVDEYGKAGRTGRTLEGVAALDQLATGFGNGRFRRVGVDKGVAMGRDGSSGLVAELDRFALTRASDAFGQNEARAREFARVPPVRAVAQARGNGDERAM